MLAGGSCHVVECVWFGPPAEGESVPESAPQETVSASKINPVTRRAHLREKRRTIYGPIIAMAAVLGLALLLMLILFSAARAAQLSIVADSLLVCFTLVPCVLGVVLIFLINMMMVFGMGALNRQVPRPFKSLQDSVNRLGASVTKLMRGLAGLVIALSVRLERWEHKAAGLGAMLRAGDSNDSQEGKNERE